MGNVTSNPSLVILIVACGLLLVFVWLMSYISNYYSLGRIKAKTTGDGQYGSARWASKDEIRQTYKHIKFDPPNWRKLAKEGKAVTDYNGNPLPPGIVVGCTGPKNQKVALVDTDKDYGYHKVLQYLMGHSSIVMYYLRNV
ncbi:MAG: hypothetical protein MJ094_08260 [Saccharofermentans sp.]|nr:hypothetical protein [Saccharofermentans sp.]